MTLDLEIRARGPGIFPLLEDFFDDKTYPHRKDTALDIGSNFGQNSKYLAQKGYTVDAIHDSLLMMTSRRYNPKIDFITVDKISTEHLPDKKYDLIINPYSMIKKDRDFSIRLIVGAIEHLKKEGYLLCELFSSDTSGLGYVYKDVSWVQGELQKVLANRVPGVNILQEKIRTQRGRSDWEDNFLDFIIQKVA